MIAIADAGPLLALAKVNALGLLSELYQQVITSPTVFTDLVHQSEGESICLSIELGADWLLMDDFDARRAALANFATAGVSTRVKGTLGLIVTAYQYKRLTQRQAIDLVNAKARPDVWASNAPYDRVIRTLQTN